MRFTIGSILALVLLSAEGCLVLPGCSITPMDKFMAGVGHGFEQMAAKADLDKLTQNANAEFHDGGIETYITVAAGIRTVGVDGTMSVAASGGGRFSPEAKAALMAQLENPSTSAEMKAQILSLLYGVQATPAKPTTGGTP